jgi:hypothetical protein
VTQDDLEIIQKVITLSKPFFIIRTKIDADADSVKRIKQDQFKEEEMLSTIRSYIFKRIKTCPKKDIFIISNYHPREWEFFQLIEAIMNVLPPSEIGE